MIARWRESAHASATRNEPAGSQPTRWVLGRTDSTVQLLKKSHLPQCHESLRWQAPKGPRTPQNRFSINAAWRGTDRSGAAKTARPKADCLMHRRGVSAMPRPCNQGPARLPRPGEIHGVVRFIYMVCAARCADQSQEEDAHHAVGSDGHDRENGCHGCPLSCCASFLGLWAGPSHRDKPRVPVGGILVIPRRG